MPYKHQQGANIVRDYGIHFANRLISGLQPINNYLTLFPRPFFIGICQWLHPRGPVNQLRQLGGLLGRAQFCMPAGANDYTKQYVREIETSGPGQHASVIHFRLKANLPGK